MGIYCNDLDAYQSTNEVASIGCSEWDKKTGKTSVWILGMYNPLKSVTVIIPTKGGDDMELGQVVNDDYFGRISDDRLTVKDNVIYFKTDGKRCGEIGVNPNRVGRFMLGYDSENKFLAILE